MPGMSGWSARPFWGHSKHLFHEGGALAATHGKDADGIQRGLC